MTSASSISSKSGLRKLAVVAGLVLVAVQIAISIHIWPEVAHKGHYWRQPFFVGNYSPDIVHVPDDDDDAIGSPLHAGDRIVAINGTRIVNRMEMVRALTWARRRAGTINLTVKRSAVDAPCQTGKPDPKQPESKRSESDQDDSTGKSTLCSFSLQYELFYDTGGRTSLASISTFAWLGFILWPISCALLAAFVLCRQAVSETGPTKIGWLASAALAGVTLIAWMPMEPFSLGTFAMPVYAIRALAPFATAFCVYWLAVHLPKPFLGEDFASYLVYGISLILALAGALRAWVDLGSLVSYKLVESTPWALRAVSYCDGAVLFSMVALAVRSLQHWRGLPARQARVQRTMFWGALLTFTSLGGLIWLISRNLTVEQAPAWFIAANWFSGAMTLSWPLAVAIVGTTSPETEEEKVAVSAELSEIEAW